MAHMTVRVPFLTKIRYFSVEGDRVAVRLTSHLENLRSARSNTRDICLSEADIAKIDHRAERIIGRRKGYVSASSLKREDRTSLTRVSTGVELNGPTTEDEADFLGAALHEEMPWLQPVTEKVWRDMRRHIQSGGVGVKFSPTLMVGPPGIGKSHFARRLGELSGTSSVVIDVSATTEGFGVVGSQRTWGNSTPGRPVQTILETGVGNPVVVIDEICKAGIVTSSGGVNTSVLHGLLGLLEPVSARNWDCPYHQTSFDMSHVNWILTANLKDRIPGALRSRMRIVSVPALTTNQLLQFCEREVRKRGLSDEIVEDILRLLCAYPEQHPMRNLRTVAKHLDDIEALCTTPILT
ncbi:MAG: hypothetical protein ACJAWM_001662 [Sulfitobacter sp.]|jgi:hypothetical protein